MTDVGEAYVLIRPRTDGFQSELQSNVGSAVANFGRQATAAVGAALAGAGVAIAGIGTAAIKASSEFNAAMSGVGAVANASSEDLLRLRDAALRAGADTSFSASQAADAQAELAKAGVSVSDILGGALAGSLGLAAAGQIGLADAATISAQALNIFNLNGDQTTRVADVLAAGANKSAADVSQLGQAMQQSGLVAAQLGIGLEDTVGTLALFADNALTGSDAGTSFKTFLQRLVPQSEDAANAMKNLGLEFFDASGQFVGIEETARQLKASLGSLSEEQRLSTLTTLFGADAIRAANLLYGAGAEGVRDYTTAVSDQGAAQRMAAAQLDNLKGDIEAFSGSLETSLIRVGDLIDPTVRRFVQGSSGLVNAFNDFAEGDVWQRIQVRIDLLGDGVTGVFDDITARVSGFLGGIDVGDVDAVFNEVERSLDRVRGALEGAGVVAAGFGAALGSTFLRAIPGIGLFVPALTPAVAALSGLVLQSDKGRDALATLADGAKETGLRLVETLGPAIGEVADQLGGALGGALEAVGEAVFAAADTLGPVFAEAIRTLGPPVSEIIDALGQLAGEIIPLAAEGFGGLVGLVTGPLGAGLSVLGDLLQLVADNSGLVVAALAGFAAVQFAPLVFGWVTAMQAFAASIASIAATRGVTQLQALGGIIAATGQQAAGAATNFLAALNPATVALTFAVTAAALAWKSYRDNAARVKDITADLNDAIRSSTAEFNAAADARTRQAFGEKEALDAFNKTGLKLGEVQEVVAKYGDQVRRLDDIYGTTGANAERFASIIDRLGLAPEVQDIANSIVELNQAGTLSDGETGRIFRALDELAQGTAKSMATARTEFTSLARTAADEGKITSEQLKKFLEDIANAKTPAELNAAFQSLSVLIGGTGNSAEDAANQIGRLKDALQGLAEGQLDADKAQRDYLDSGQRLLETIGKYGAGVDQSTEAGRRNREALDAQVEAAFRLSEAQAAVDASGATSRATLEAQAETLRRLREQGIIPTDAEYQRLLQTYGLTPDQINTTVTADVQDAQRKASDIKAQVEALPGVTQAEILEIQALIDKGDINAAQNKLNELERTYRPKVVIDWGNLKIPFTNIGLGVKPNADGSVLSFYGQGGVRENHVAQIAPAGAWRVWAEPETGGEAYIPLAATKRKRSLDIWRLTGRLLGVQGFAQGGVVGMPAAAAAPPAVAPAAVVPAELTATLKRLEAAIAASTGATTINVDRIVTPDPTRVPEQLVRAAREARVVMA